MEIRKIETTIAIKQGSNYISPVDLFSFCRETILTQNKDVLETQTKKRIGMLSLVGSTALQHRI